MKTVGLFEAKTRLSEICDEVARSKDSVVITRRGKPLVRIDPVETDKFSVWEDRVEYIARTGRLKQEFDLPPRSPELPASPLDD
jgi:prevent-host-death family protein